MTAPSQPVDGPAFSVIQEGSPDGVPVKIVAKSRAETSESVILFSFHGALDQSKRTLPYFDHAYPLAAMGGASTTVISVSDPSLRCHRELGLAWYAGDPLADTMTLLAALVDALLQANPKAKFIFEGGSTGARPALLLSHRVPESLCVVSNPLVSMRHWPKGVVDYARWCWPELPLDTVIADREVNGVLQLYPKGHTNWVIVLQNAFDPFFPKSILPILGGAFTNSKRFLLLSEYFEGLLAHDYPWQNWKAWRRAFTRSNPIILSEIAQAAAECIRAAQPAERAPKTVRAFDPRDLEIARQLHASARSSST